MEDVFDYTIAPILGRRAVLGMVVLQSDETLEHDLRRILPQEEVALYISRVPSAETVSSDSLAAMEGHLSDAAALMPPALDFDVLGYGCTSATSVIGAGRVAELLRKGCPATHVTDPLSALVAACRHMGITRLAFLSPYVPEVSSRLRAAVAAQGVKSPVFGTFNEAREHAVALIDGPSVSRAATALLQRGGAEAVFLSCTNLRTLDVIDAIEAETGAVALSSNQVMGWHMCQLAGIRPALRVGRLMAEPLFARSAE